MSRTIQIRRLTARTVFRIVALGLLVPIIGFTLMCGLLAYSGTQAVFVNGRPVTGSDGLLLSMALAPMFWALASVLIWLQLIVGLWFYSLVRPIEIRYIPTKSTTLEVPESELA